MYSRPTSRLASFQKQNLLLEFAALRHANLEGVYVSISSDDPTLWLGVIFVRKGKYIVNPLRSATWDYVLAQEEPSKKLCDCNTLANVDVDVGPYAPAVLRFQISFPPTYPALPPLVTFSTDIFHPFLTPLTTFTYTTGASDTDTVSARDEERLPPGGFSLRHGFPHWFARASRSAASSRTPSGQTPAQGGASATPASPSISMPPAESPPRNVAVAEVLRYILASFTDESILNSVTLATAANPGAYHAWRTYKGRDPRSQTTSPMPGVQPGEVLSPGRRKPGEWNWEGVWEDRVKKGIKASLSDPVLFGGGTDEIHFLATNEEELERIKNDMKLTVAT